MASKSNKAFNDTRAHAPTALSIVLERATATAAESSSSSSVPIPAFYLRMRGATAVLSPVPYSPILDGVTVPPGADIPPTSKGVYDAGMMMVVMCVVNRQVEVTLRDGCTVVGTFHALSADFNIVLLKARVSNASGDDITGQLHEKYRHVTSRIPKLIIDRVDIVVITVGL